MAAPIIDHLYQAAPRMAILGELFEMVREVLYPLGQYRYLHFWRSSILAVALVILDYLTLLVTV